MKINMPVTNQEVLMKKGQILVSRTDLKGIITYANDDFVSISGFSRNELIGASHNIVRHPDMPPAVFEDLWHAVRALRPWQGMIKNRTKFGDYYWVNASVLPIFKDGKVHEYLSVRRLPSREQIEQVEQLHRRLNANQASLRPTGWAAATKTVKEVQPLKKTFFSLAVLSMPIIYQLYQLFLARDYLLFAAMMVSVLGALMINIQVAAHFSSLLNKTIGIFYRLAEKRFGNVKDLARNDLIGDFQRALYSMEVNLNLDLAQAKDQATKVLRISEALDHVHAGIMLADNDLNIIYINDSIQDMFRKAESDIRQQLPNFSADRLIGENIDRFHKDPSFQRRLLANLREPHHSELQIANLYMTVIASPVINDDGERIGIVAEWHNKTHEVRVEQEIDDLVRHVKEGNLSYRLDLNDKTGFEKTLSSGINELTDVIESVFSDVNSVMERMAEGDLTATITNHYQGIYDECKNNINTTLAKLSEFIVQIRDAADLIDSSSQEMASGNNNLSHRAEQQAASLEQTAASMEELASTVKDNAVSTQQAKQLVTSSSQLAQIGGEVVQSAIAAMQDINTSSDRIAEIISVIDEIAFQTNLLALNASVEAARAGEHGRGFSVVAIEVRNLAQRSANAAQRSKELIQNSIDNVRTGTAFVNETGTALREIVSSVAKVGDLVAQIASASDEQTAGIDQVNQAIAQMDDITQQNAALAEQASAGSIAMSEQATNMSKLLSFFKADSTGRSKLPKVSIQENKVRTATAKSTTKQAIKTVSAAHSKIDPSDDWEEF